MDGPIPHISLFSMPLWILFRCVCSLSSGLSFALRKSGEATCGHLHPPEFALSPASAVHPLLPSFNFSLTTTFDDLVLQALSTSANIEMDGATRVQAQLPVRWGGLGLRSVTQLAPSAFLSSLTAAESLLRALLPLALLATLDPSYDAAISCWQALAGGGATIPAIETVRGQRGWDDQVCSSQYDALVAAASGPAVHARLLAVKAEGSGAWLQALPASSLGSDWGMTNCA
jgi:hypothetical protein